MLWRIGYVIVTTIFVLIATGVMAAASDLPVAVRVAVPLAVLAVGIALTVALPAAVYRRWRYAVTDDGVELRHGLIVHHESSIPHFRVQHIDIDQGPLDRWRGS